MLVSAESLPRAVDVSARLLKGVVKSAVQVSGLAHRRARQQGGAHIIMFHGVGGDDLPVEAFRRVLQWLQTHFDVVTLDEVVERLGTHGAPMSHCVALTFDDGLKNNLTVAQPILQDHSAPATFFVCPGLIDDGRWLWTHDARARLDFVRREHGVAGLHPLRQLGFGSGDPVEWMKQLAIPQRLEVEGWLETASSGFVPDSRQLAASALLDWDDLLALDNDLITVGSHTLSHPMLSSLTPADADREIRESATRLGTKLDREIDYFCYPNGDFQPTHLDTVRESYRAGVGTKPGVNLPGRDLANLLRVPVSASVRNFAWSVCRASA